MKNTILLITAMGLALTPIQSQAGDKEWGVVGKVLTGVFALKILDDIVTPRHHHHVEEVVVVQEAPVCHTPVTVVEHHSPTVVVEHHHTPTVIVKRSPRRYRTVTTYYTHSRYRGSMATSHLHLHCP